MSSLLYEHPVVARTVDVDQAMKSLEPLIDKTFGHSYECEQPAELPGTSLLAHYYYPGASRVAGRDGLIVEVRPDHGQQWLGTFAFGQIAPMGTSGVFTTPDPDRFCVVARGEGYFVSANAPESWERVQANPIIDVRPIGAKGIMIFADFTQLVAYGQTGLKWKSKRLSWDNLRVIEVTDTSIKGEFWDIRSETTARFVVDLATGTHLGGVEED